MSKTILADVDGFTPVIDAVLNDTSLITAVVFGRVWRFCQMKDGICNASLETIAQSIGLGRSAVMEHAKILVEKGYLKDCSPELKNHPHTYADTGKAGLHIGVSAESGVHYVNVENDHVHQMNASVHQANASVHVDDLKIVLKKDSNKQENDPEKQKIMCDLRHAAQSIFGHNFKAWNELERYLEPDCVKIVRQDGHLVVSGVGMPAAMLQDCYAKTFTNALAGIYNESVELVFNE